MAFDRKKKDPKKTLRAGRRALILRRVFPILIAVLILSLHFIPGARKALSSLFPFAEPVHRTLNAEGALAVHFIAVGQGDATLIVSPEGDAVLVDAGPPESAVERESVWRASWRGFTGFCGDARKWLARAGWRLAALSGLLVKCPR